MSIIRQYLFCLLTYIGILGQEFGSTIDDGTSLQITADVGKSVKAKVNKFDIYFAADDEERILLEILTPVDIDKDENEKKVYVVAFTHYSPNSNPIVNGSLSPEMMTNCSNYQLNTMSPLADLFDPPLVDIQTITNNTEDADAPFFKGNIVNEEGQDYLQYTHDGPLSVFSQCDVRAEDRDKVWSISTDNSTGKTNHSTVVVLNEMTVTKEQHANDTTFKIGYFSTAFQLTWSVSQYIIVSTVLASQKRVVPELVYASVQLLWEKGTLTDQTLVHIGIRTTLENAYNNHLMMAFVSDSGLFITGSNDTANQYQARNSPSTDTEEVKCDPHTNFHLGGENLEQDTYVDCQQTWEFDVVLPPEVSAHKEVEGMFVFQLQLYECNDLSVAQNCGPVEVEAERITAMLTLDSVVEMLADKENTLGLQVTAITSKDKSADFLRSGAQDRGIYHQEDVVIYIEPTQNINKVPGADLISQHGLVLSAFFVCIESRITTGSRMGCLDVPEEYRYIPYIEEDLEITIGGQMYQRSDFEATKQSLTSHSWDKDSASYSIEFKNLALSARTRLYRVTMIFRLNYTDTENKSGRRKRRSVIVSEPLSFKKREIGVDGGNATSSVNKTTEDTTEDTAGGKPTTDEQNSNSSDSGVVDTNTEKKQTNNTAGTNEDTETNDDTETISDTSDEADYTTDDNRETDSIGVATVGVKSEGCPEGTIYKSVDEPCHEYPGTGGATRQSCYLVSLVLVLFRVL